MVIEKRKDRLIDLYHRYGVESQNLEETNVFFLTVKPQDFKSTLVNVKNIKNALIISLMAGMQIDRIESEIGKSNRVIRVMSNTPIIVGEGMSVIATGRDATASDLDWTKTVFGNSGKVIILNENLMDTVTAVSGAGPAYFFAFIEALIRAATKLGLSPTDAEVLVGQTFLGSAKLFSERKESSTKLKRDVTSPGGVTEAAISILDNMHLQEIVDNSLEAARFRSVQLSKQT
jgi:pyrroline-5-carboxylate reductase